MVTTPTPNQPDELAKIESKAGEVSGLAGMIMSGISMFSMLRKQKNPMADQPRQTVNPNGVTNSAVPPSAPTTSTVPATPIAQNETGAPENPPANPSV